MNNKQQENNKFGERLMREGKGTAPRMKYRKSCTIKDNLSFKKDAFEV